MLQLSVLLASTLGHAKGLADCERTFDTLEILEAATATEMAFTKVDAVRFKEARASVEARVACARDVLSPSAQARIHRVEALGAFLDGRQERVPWALAGVFAAEPGHQIPSALLPDGHPIRGQVAAAMLYLRDDAGADFPAPASGWVEIDGTHALRAPALRASILQQFDGQGAVIATHHRWPDEPGFDWLVPVPGSQLAAVNLSTPAAQVQRAPASPWGRRAPWLALSGASLITSGVLYALAADGKAEFDAQPVLDGSASDAERAQYREALEGMQTNTNGLSYGCYLAAGASVALGAVAVVTW